MNSDATEATGVTNSSAARDKGFRIQKKRSIPTNSSQTLVNKKKPGSKSSSKKSGGGPYNEGAEENKGWLNDDGVTASTI
jgi:Tubulin-tyrosine ligase family